MACVQILMTVIMREAWAMWRGWSCAHPDTQEKLRRDICALMPSMKQVG